MIKFVSDLWLVSGFLCVLWFPPQYNKYYVESGVKTIKQINKQSVIQFYEDAIQMLKLHMTTFQV